jgi:hypothetical protein
MIAESGMRVVVSRQRVERHVRSRELRQTVRLTELAHRLGQPDDAGAVPGRVRPAPQPRARPGRGSAEQVHGRADDRVVAGEREPFLSQVHRPPVLTEQLGEMDLVLEGQLRGVVEHVDEGDRPGHGADRSQF